LTLTRNVQKEFLIGQSSRSHATYRPTISGWLLVGLSTTIQAQLGRRSVEQSAYTLHLEGLGQLCATCKQSSYSQERGAALSDGSAASEERQDEADAADDDDKDAHL